MGADDFADDFLRLPRRDAVGQPAPGGFLPSTAGGRLAAGLLSAMLLPLAAAAVFALPAEPPGRNPGWWAALAALDGLFAAVLGLCGCGLAWAVATPRWVGPLAWRCRRRLGVLVVAFYLAVGVWAAWPG